MVPARAAYGPRMLWAKLLVPVVLVAGGGAAAVAAGRGSSPSESVTADAAVWIDNPAPGAVFAPGEVGIDAHAVAGQEVTALALYVDGDRVAVDEDPARARDLVYATFAWSAEAGTHSLEVAQVGGDRARSEPREVVIVEGAPPAPEPAPAPGATTSTTSLTTSTTSTTTTLPGGATTVPGEAPVTIAPPTATTAPPATVPPTSQPTTAPPTPPAIEDASLSSPSGALVLYVRDCGYTVLVSAVVRDATSVVVDVEGTGVGGTMDRSGTTYRFTLRSGTFGSGAIGVHRVVVTAWNGSASATLAAGRVTIEQGCPKD